MEIVDADVHRAHGLGKTRHGDIEIAEASRRQSNRRRSSANVLAEIVEQELAGRAAFRVGKDVEVHRFGQALAVNLDDCVAVVAAFDLLGTSDPQPGTAFDRCEGQLELIDLTGRGERAGEHARPFTVIDLPWTGRLKANRRRRICRRGQGEKQDEARDDPH